MLAYGCLLITHDQEVVTAIINFAVAITFQTGYDQKFIIIMYALLTTPMLLAVVITRQTGYYDFLCHYSCTSDHYCILL